MTLRLWLMLDNNKILVPDCWRLDEETVKKVLSGVNSQFLSEFSSSLFSDIQFWPPEYQ